MLQALQAWPVYAEWPPRQQARAYAAAADSDMPWSGLLHRERKGVLNLAAARRLFHSIKEMGVLFMRLHGAE